MNIEFLRAWDDNTWDTEVFEVPRKVVGACTEGSPLWRTRVIDWAERNLHPKTKYRGIVLWAIYGWNYDDE